MNTMAIKSVLIGYMAAAAILGFRLPSANAASAASLAPLTTALSAAGPVEIVVGETTYRYSQDQLRAQSHGVAEDAGVLAASTGSMSAAAHLPTWNFAASVDGRSVAFHLNSVEVGEDGVLRRITIDDPDQPLRRFLDTVLEPQAVIVIIIIIILVLIPLTAKLVGPKAGSKGGGSGAGSFVYTGPVI